MSGLIVDLFAGAGGASLGLEMALGRAVDVAVNHNPEAVAIHAANHPTTRHFVQNICDVPPRLATGGRPVDILWASPDCKHFSKAKGAAPKERNIRELAWAVVKWARDTRPKLMIVENVEEFQTWGPLDGDGQPIKDRAGETFRAWIEALRAEGYRVDWRPLRACDYGAPTIRRRLFIVARRDRKPIVWPKPSHGPGQPKPWRTAAECIDWSLPVPSIFNRKKSLAENTLRRIAEGIRRYVIEAPEPFIVPGSDARSAWILQANTGPFGRPADWPLSTICQTGSQQQLAAASLAPFIQHIQHGGARPGVMPAQEPLRTITANPKGGCMALAAASLVHYYGPRPGARPRCGSMVEPIRTATSGGNRFGLAVTSLVPFLAGAGGPAYSGKPTALGQPLGAMVSRNHRSLVPPIIVEANHTASYYKFFRGQNLPSPLRTITQSHGFALAVAHLSHFYGTLQGGNLVKPHKTVTAGGQHFGLAAAFLTKFFGTATANDLTWPASTICQDDKLALACAFLTKYFGTGSDQTLRAPVGTLATKDRFGLVYIVQAVPLVYVNSEAYVIADIGLRMLTPRELARAQGFPDGYILNPIYNGRPLTHKAQVAGIGNSVPPAFAEALVKANRQALDWQPPVRPRPAPLFEFGTEERPEA